MKENMKILVALDFSENPDVVYKEAITVADQFKSTIYLIHVIEDMPHISFYSDAYKLWEDFREQAVKETLEKMTTYVREFTGNFENVEIIVEVGDTGEKIAEVANRLNIDMLILGHHDRSNIQEIFHRSICEQVVKNAKKPILTYHIPQ